MKRIKTLTLFFLSFTVSFHAFATAERILFTKALKKNLITVSATSKGGYQGLCLELAISNKTSLPINVIMDPALIFRPTDTAFQDMVLAGGNLLALKPRETSSITVQTFCGKSYARGPVKGLTYNFMKQGDATMMNVATFIQTHKLYNRIGQHAIWSLTNNHSLSGIYDYADTGISKRLISYIAGMTGQPIPQFYTTHKVEENGSANRVFNPTIEKYVIVVEWQKPSARNMHVQVYSEDGKLFREEKIETINKFGHKVTVELDPKKIPKGLYTVMLRDDDNIVYQKNEVQVE